MFNRKLSHNRLSVNLKFKNFKKKVIARDKTLIPTPYIQQKEARPFNGLPVCEISLIFKM